MTPSRKKTAPKAPPPGRRAKSKNYDGTFDKNGIWEIHVFAEKLGITRQDVNDRFRKAGMRATDVGEFCFITGEEFFRWLKERECGWGEEPNSKKEG